MTNALAAVRSFAGKDFDIMAEMGRDERGLMAYLARERSTGELVALRVDTQVASQGAAAVTLSRTLGSAVPSMSRTCPACNASLVDWRRFCHLCGVDLAGELVHPEQARSVTEESLVVLGQIPRTEGGAAVYFGKERTTGQLLAFDLKKLASGDPEAGKLSVSIASELAPTGAADAIAPPEPRAQPTPPPAPEYPTAAAAAVAAATAIVKICPACSKEYPADTRFCPEDGSVLRVNTPDNLVGQIIGERYAILSKIGHGGMGQVYLAEHIRMHRRCAIKVLHRSMTNDVAAVNRFSREATNASRINHENVADIYDFGESEQHGIYIAMEYVEGDTLSRILSTEGQLSIERTLSIAIQVCNGLSAAHRQGVVHRDLTPNNIVIGKAEGVEQVKIVDFGIAKAMQSSEGGLTRTGYVIGTPQYMSPEQLMGEEVDGRSDIYSLGCILFEMVTSTQPFIDAAGVQQVTRRLLEDAPRARDRNPAVPDEIDALISRALARQASNRFASAHELRDALSNIAMLIATQGDADQAYDKIATDTVRRTGQHTPPTRQRTAPAPVTAVPAPRTRSPGTVDLRPAGDPANRSAFVGPVKSGSTPHTGSVHESEAERVLTIALPSSRTRRRIVPFVVLAGFLVAGGVIAAAVLGGGPEPEPTPEPTVDNTKAVAPASIPDTQPSSGGLTPPTNTAEVAVIPGPATPLGTPEQSNAGGGAPPVALPPARLFFKSALPANAVVQVDGKPVRLRNGIVEVEPGIRQVTVLAPGYVTVHEAVRAARGATFELNPTLVAAPVVPTPVAPRPDPTPPPLRLDLENSGPLMEAVIRRFASALADGDQAELRRLVPTSSAADQEHWRTLRGEGALRASLPELRPIRFDPAGSVYRFVLTFTDAQGLGRPVPVEATLAHIEGTWRLLSFRQRQ